MSQLNMFIPLTKVDVAQQLVYGIATCESVDKSREICDYASTKPLYQKWSEEIAKASQGRSLGNVRAMHNKIAAGVVKEINYNDEAKQIEICAKVVDDNEWKKVLEGVYTGFSQGGAYVKIWDEPSKPGVKRYTANPIEVSLVDNPCLADATFQVIKENGETELRKFTSPEGPTTPATPAPAVGKLNPDNVGSPPREPGVTYPDEVQEKPEVILKAIELHKGAHPGVDPLEELFRNGNLVVRRWSYFLDKARGELTVPLPNSQKPVEKTETPAPATTTTTTPAPAYAPAALPAEQVQSTPDLIQGWRAKDGSFHVTKKAAADHNIALDAATAARAALGPLTDAIGAANATLDKRDNIVKTPEEALVVALAVLGKDEYATDHKLKADELAAQGLYKRKFTADQRKKAASEGKAMPDGSFPIENEEDLHNAVRLAGDSKDPAAAKKHIIARAKAMGLMGAIPDSWKASKAAPKKRNRVKAGAYGKDVEPDLKKRQDALTKHLYDTGRVANMICDMDWLAECLEMEAAAEGDDSMTAMRLKGIRDQLCIFLRELVEEETSEIMDGTEDDEIFELAVGFSGARLIKVLEAAKVDVEKVKGFVERVAKIVEKASKADMVHLQSAHDHIAAVASGETCAGMDKSSKMDGQLQAAHDILAGMGTDCSSTMSKGAQVPSVAPAPMEKLAQAEQDLQKALALNAELTKTVNETLLPQVQSLVKRVKDLEAQPLPPKGVARPVSKMGDVTSHGGEVAPDGVGPVTDEQAFQAWQKMSPTDRAQLAMKMALGNGQAVTRGFFTKEQG